MRIPGDAEFLVLWESGYRRHPLDRALLALAVAFPELGHDALAAWPLGHRNRSLLALHDRCFGHDLPLWTGCYACGEKLEIELDARELAGAEPRDFEGATVTVNGSVFRLPNSRDLARAASEDNPTAGASRILDGCIVSAEPPAHWSDEDLSVIGDQLALADPLAEIRLTLRCPACEAEWEESLDPEAVFWSEVQGRARQVLFEIHTLASAYGWSEADILAMSKNRRAVYLEMVQP